MSLEDANCIGTSAYPLDTEFSESPDGKGRSLGPLRWFQAVEYYLIRLCAPSTWVGDTASCGTLLLVHV